MLIYIGQARNGIIRRWVTEPTAHCEAVKKVLEMKTNCTSFEEMGSGCKDLPVQLVDCYLAWAILRGVDTALFVVRHCTTANRLDTDEQLLIKQHDATNMQHGLNCRQ